MKKLISIALLLALCLSLFAGCNNKPAEPTSDLPNAKAYLINMYQTAGKGEVMVLTTDKDVLAKVIIDGVSYDVEWTVNVTAGSADDIKVGESAKGNHVKLDINEKPAEDLKFTATATVKDADGNSEKATFDYMVKAAATAGMTDEQIVEEAYKLADGEVMEGNATLTGLITMIKTAWSEDYKNITVIIQIGDLADKKIECFRLQGEGAKEIGVGDTITVTGVLKNYMGTIEFDAGCNLDKVVKGDTVVAPSDPKEIVDAAFGLEPGTALPYAATLTGKIIEINTPFDPNYNNVTVTIEVEGSNGMQELKCYLLKGEGADALVVGDTITVTGMIKNYVHTSGDSEVEYDAGCHLDAVVKGEGGNDKPSDDKPSDDKPSDDKPSDDKPSDDKPSDDKPVVAPTKPADIVDAAYALDKDEKLPYNSTLTGKITKVDTAYNEQYKNITVTIAVAGRETKPIQCFRLTGTGVENLAVGDTITVTGNLINYNGKVQFDAKCNLDKVVAGPKAPTDPKAIVDAAYALEKNTALDYEATLTGKIVELNTPYDAKFKNMTVTIAVAGREDKPIECFRMKGDKASNDLCVGDTITVTGTIKNYNGTVEFDAGCIVSKVVSGGVKKPTDSKAIVDAAFALAEGESLAYFATLTGEVTAIDGEGYSSQYKNITLTITVEGKDIVCYRMKGDDAASVKVGDTISVTGILMNFKGTIEFGSGCTCVKA